MNLRKTPSGVDFCSDSNDETVANPLNGEPVKPVKGKPVK